MQLVVITGMSGAGKASAAKVFEDMAYTVVDNLPPPLLPELVAQCLGVGEQPPAQRLAVVTDARAGRVLRRPGAGPRAGPAARRPARSSCSWTPPTPC